MENLPSIDQIKDAVKEFNLARYVDRRTVTALALYGVCKIGYEVLWVPSYGFWTHFI